MKLVWLTMLSLLTFAPIAHAIPVPSAACAPIAPSVRELLSFYSRKDTAAVLRLTDPHELLVLGTDVSEIADTEEKVQTLLQADFALWGSSEFGAPVFMSCRVGAKLATAAFDVPFTMHRQNGHTDTMTIRFLTVWHEIGERWYLTQSLNSVPTVGQSAMDMPKPAEKLL